MVVIKQGGVPEMYLERKDNIEENATIVFNCNVNEKNLSNFPKNFNGNIVIYGEIDVCDKICIPGNLFVKGDIYCETLTVKGNFQLIGDIEGNIDVCGNCDIQGDIDAEIINIKEDFYYSGEYLKVENLFVNGDFSFTGLNIYGNTVIVAGNCYGSSETFFENLQILGDINYKRLKSTIFGSLSATKEITATNVKITNLNW